MKEAFPFMPVPVDTFVRATMRVSTAEAGCHMLLLCAAWSSPGCSLPDDDMLLMRLTRSDKRTWSRIKSAVMSLWVLGEDGQWRHPEQIRQYEHCVTSREQKRANAEKTNEAKRQAKLLKEQEAADAQRAAERDAQRAAERTHMKTETETETESKKNSLSLSDGSEGRTPEPDHKGFKAFWTAYPRRDDDSESRAYEAWLSLSPEKRIAAMAAVPKYKAKAVPPYIHKISTFLLDGIYENHPPDPIDWAGRLTIARMKEVWRSDHWGPMPHEPGCMVPNELLLASDGNGWLAVENLKDWKDYPDKHPHPRAPRPVNPNGDF